MLISLFLINGSSQTTSDTSEEVIVVDEEGNIVGEGISISSRASRVVDRVSLSAEITDDSTMIYCPVAISPIEYSITTNYLDDTGIEYIGTDLDGDYNYDYSANWKLTTNLDDLNLMRVTIAKNNDIHCTYGEDIIATTGCYENSYNCKLPTQSGFHNDEILSIALLASEFGTENLDCEFYTSGYYVSCT